jgi:hypothetical protein
MPILKESVFTNKVLDAVSDYVAQCKVLKCKPNYKICIDKVAKETGFDKSEIEESFSELIKSEIEHISLDNQEVDESLSDPKTVLDALIAESIEILSKSGYKVEK